MGSLLRSTPLKYHKMPHKSSLNATRDDAYLAAEGGGQANGPAGITVTNGIGGASQAAIKSDRRSTDHSSEPVNSMLPPQVAQLASSAGTSIQPAPSGGALTPSASAGEAYSTDTGGCNKRGRSSTGKEPSSITPSKRRSTGILNTAMVSVFPLQQPSCRPAIWPVFFIVSTTYSQCYHITML